MFHAVVAVVITVLRALVIVSTLVLRLKAAETFLETKIRITKCEKS